MKSSLSTGGFRDFIELTAETTAECADLVRIATSNFLEPDRALLCLMEEKTIKLRIWASIERKKELDPAMREALDQVP